MPYQHEEKRLDMDLGLHNYVVCLLNWTLNTAGETIYFLFFMISAFSDVKFY